MSEPSQQELQESIEQLIEYRERLSKEVKSVAQKLKMPRKKIEKVLSEHAELSKLNAIIAKLKNQRNNTNI